MRNLSDQFDKIEGVNPEITALISAYVKDLLQEDHSTLLDEIGGNSFLPIYVESTDEAASLLNSKDDNNIINRAFNIIGEPLNRVFFIFVEPSIEKEIEVYILRSDFCTEEFLQFIEYIYDDVEDEDDRYIPPYEVS